MSENPNFIEVTLDLGGNGVWTNYKALGFWRREGLGEDGRVEVYLPGHPEHWDEVYRAEYGESPNGLPQTKIVLEPQRARYLDVYT